MNEKKVFVGAVTVKTEKVKLDIMRTTEMKADNNTCGA